MFKILEFYLLTKIQTFLCKSNLQFLTLRTSMQNWEFCFSPVSFSILALPKRQQSIKCLALIVLQREANMSLFLQLWMHMVQIVHVGSCPRKSLLFQTLLIYPIAYCRYIAHILPCTRTCDMVEIVQGHVTWWKLCKDMWHGGNCKRTCDMVEIVQGYVTWWKLYKDMWHGGNCTRIREMVEIVQGHVTWWKL